MANDSIENTVLSRIYGSGRGWTLSQIDFAALGSRPAIDSSLHRLQEKGVIRRVMRGIYDYPQFSELLKKALARTSIMSPTLSRENLDGEFNPTEQLHRISSGSQLKFPIA
jgi:hypothetical protein